MPSKRKRIGFLPSPKVHELINMISEKECLSQSRVVGILVQEALSYRGFSHDQISIDLNNRKIIKDKENSYEELDELVSDSGITYNLQK